MADSGLFLGLVRRNGGWRAALALLLAAFVLLLAAFVLLLAASHAAWDVDAVHGVHAVHSVSNLGTGREKPVRLVRMQPQASNLIDPA